MQRSVVYVESQSSAMVDDYRLDSVVHGYHTYKRMCRRRATCRHRRKKTEQLQGNSSLEGVESLSSALLTTVHSR